jgi:hypothetical protein
MENHRENRKGDRAAFHKSIQYEYCETQAGRFVHGLKTAECIDICDGGLGLCTKFPLQEREVLKLHVPITEAAARLPVYTEVMWSRYADGEFRAGLRFLA